MQTLSKQSLFHYGTVLFKSVFAGNCVSGASVDPENFTVMCVLFLQDCDGHCHAVAWKISSHHSGSLHLEQYSRRLNDTGNISPPPPPYHLIIFSAAFKQTQRFSLWILPLSAPESFRCHSILICLMYTGINFVGYAITHCSGNNCSRVLSEKYIILQKIAK